MSSKRYKVLVEGRDAGLGFLTAYEMVADSHRELPGQLTEWARSEGWTFIGVEEVEELGHNRGTARPPLRLTGRTYFELD